MKKRSANPDRQRQIIFNPSAGISVFVSKYDFYKRTYHISSSIPERVRYIPLLENSDRLFMAGDNLERVWRNLWIWKGEMRKEFPGSISLYGYGCPAQGCHHCTNPDCSYADFISRYWDYPRCD